MLPTPKDVHLNAATSQFSVMNMGQRFIADQLFPTVGVSKMSDYYYKFPKGAWFRNEANLRGPGGAARRLGYQVTSDTYSCKERAAAHPVPKETIANADDPIRPEQTGIAFAKNAVLLKKEVEMSTLLTTAGNWTTSEDAEGGWAASETDNTFIADVISKQRVVQELIGVMPNVMWMDGPTWDNVRQISGLLDLIKNQVNNQFAEVTPGGLAALFDLDRILIGQAIRSSAEEVMAGTDFTKVRLWEANTNKGSAGLLYVPPAAGLEIPSAGYQIRWDELATDNDQAEIIESADGWLVTRYWEPQTKSWVYDAAQSYDLKITSADAGAIFTDTIAT